MDIVMYNLSVLIPNYNGRSLLEANLPAVFNAIQHTSIITQYEVIVVDDASTDDSIDFLQRVYPQIKVIPSTTNQGFAITVNKGINEAHYETVCILNTDIVLSNDYFMVLLPLLTSNVFGVFGALRNPDTNAIIEGRKEAVIRHPRLGYKDLLGEDEAGESMYLCGGNALINTAKLRVLGGYDEKFSPFYWEDMDLSLRAKQKGWLSLYTARTSCLHKHSATINTHFTRAYIREIYVRNRVYINYKHLPKHSWHRFIFLSQCYLYAMLERLFHLHYQPYYKGLLLKENIRPL